MTRSRAVLLGLLVVGVLVLTACAAGPNNVARVDAPAELAGFWQGLWQGLIIPVTFVISLFNDHVSIYEVHNDGNWYDFGFVLGLALLSSITAAPARATAGRRR